MAWTTWGGWNKAWTPASSKGQGKGNKRKGEKKDGYIGYDGKHVSYTPSSVEQAPRPRQDSETSRLEQQLATMKAALQHVVQSQGLEIPSSVKEALAESPSKELREKQKALNAERKRMQRTRQLEQQIEKEETQFAKHKEVLKQETKRHEEKMQSLREKLEEAQQIRETRDTAMSDSEDEEPCTEAKREKDREEKTAEALKQLESQNTVLHQNQTELMNQLQSAMQMIETAQQQTREKDADIATMRALIAQQSAATGGPLAPSPQKIVEPKITKNGPRKTDKHAEPKRGTDKKRSRSPARNTEDNQPGGTETVQSSPEKPKG